MHEVALIGDLHLGHNAIMEMRGFTDMHEYHEEIIKRWNSVCGKKTMVILMGDLSMENSKYYYLLDRMLGRKIFVGGNHDVKKDFNELIKHVECVLGAYKYKNSILTHIPVHPQELRTFDFNIHAHTHEKSVMFHKYEPLNVKVSIVADNRYKCVSWDQLNGIPISWKELMLK